MSPKEKDQAGLWRSAVRSLAACLRCRGNENSGAAAFLSPSELCLWSPSRETVLSRAAET
jgi:hypothetical protein